VKQRLDLPADDTPTSSASEASLFRFEDERCSLLRTDGRGGDPDPLLVFDRL